ncbi:hypothetical protein N9D02_03605 [Emcibacteraceae bacterium]|nr:hypothetical protein [Emcibacteraceae bacterium]MDA9554543.1 hypothetical protein [Emcibacteraceae bacterium]MDA9770103.1 hypothetical protein [Emcibacteraceae bacterium]MDC1090143.1 hypothetical protein [Emcibacteraceae bacterium]
MLEFIFDTVFDFLSAWDMIGLLLMGRFSSSLVCYLSDMKFIGA